VGPASATKAGSGASVGIASRVAEATAGLPVRKWFQCSLRWTDSKDNRRQSSNLESGWN
jgi:hypothetical protein